MHGSHWGGIKLGSFSQLASTTHNTQPSGRFWCTYREHRTTNNNWVFTYFHIAIQSSVCKLAHRYFDLSAPRSRCCASRREGPTFTMDETTEWLRKTKVQLTQAAEMKTSLVDLDGFKTALNPADVSQLNIIKIKVEQCDILIYCLFT